MCVCVVCHFHSPSPLLICLTLLHAGLSLVQNRTPLLLSVCFIVTPWVYVRCFHWEGERYSALAGFWMRALQMGRQTWIYKGYALLEKRSAFLFEAPYSLFVSSTVTRPFFKALSAGKWYENTSAHSKVNRGMVLWFKPHEFRKGWTFDTASRSTPHTQS